MLFLVEAMTKKGKTTRKYLGIFDAKDRETAVEASRQRVLELEDDPQSLLITPVEVNNFMVTITEDMRRL